MDSPFLELLATEINSINRAVYVHDELELKNPLINPEKLNIGSQITKQIDYNVPLLSDLEKEDFGDVKSLNSNQEFFVEETESSAQVDKISDYFKVSKTIIKSYDGVFRKSWSAKFRELVEWVSAQVDINPGLVAVNLIAETSPLDYLGGQVSSFLIGTDDFYEKRKDLEKKVPAFKLVNWFRNKESFNRY